MAWRRLAIGVWLCAAACAQQPGLEQILQQLNRLQQENNELNRQIDVLRKQILDLQSSAKVPVEEKLDVVAQRVEDLASSKVEAA